LQYTINGNNMSTSIFRQKSSFSEPDSETRANHRLTN